MKSLEGDHQTSIKKKKENRFAGFAMLSPLLLFMYYSYAIGGTFGYGSTMMVTRRGESENFELILEAE
jgi:hypothetical protein